MPSPGSAPAAHRECSTSPQRPPARWTCCGGSATSSDSCVSEVCRRPDSLWTGARSRSSRAPSTSTAPPPRSSPVPSNHLPGTTVRPAGDPASPAGLRRGAHRLRRAHYDTADDADVRKNGLCGKVRLLHALEDYPAAIMVTMRNRYHWGQDQALRRSIRDSRIDGFGKLTAEGRPRRPAQAGGPGSLQGAGLRRDGQPQLERKDSRCPGATGSVPRRPPVRGHTARPYAATPPAPARSRLPEARLSEPCGGRTGRSDSRGRRRAVVVGAVPRRRPPRQLRSRPGPVVRPAEPVPGREHQGPAWVHQARGAGPPRGAQDPPAPFPARVPQGPVGRRGTTSRGPYEPGVVVAEVHRRPCLRRLEPGRRPGTPPGHRPAGGRRQEQGRRTS